MTTAVERAPIDVDSVVAAWTRGDDEAVIATFAGRSEKERRAVAKALFAASVYPDHPAPPPYPYDYRDTVVTALFACGTLTELKRLRSDHQWGKMCNEQTFRVLVDRRPPWVTAWAEWALDRNATPSALAGGTWWLVRKLMRAGVCDPLDTDAYILGMVFGLSDRDYTVRSRWHGNAHLGIPRDDVAMKEWRDRYEGDGRVKLADRLRADPGLLDHEIWRIFEVPGRPSLQLGHLRRDGRDWWIDTFVDLVTRGDIDRDRVLAAAIDALARDISQLQSKWFIALWHALEPTPDERLHFQPQLLHLLTHPVSSIDRFSLDELDLLDQAGVLDVGRFVEDIDGVLLTAPVALAEAAVRMLDRIGRREPDHGIEVGVATASALLHANPKVRARAAKVLDVSPQRDAPQVVDAIERAGFDDAVVHGKSLADAVLAQPAPATPVNAVLDADRDETYAVPPRIAAWRGVLVAYLEEWLRLATKTHHVLGIIDASPGPWRFDTGEPGSLAFVVDALLGEPRLPQWSRKTFLLHLVEPDAEQSSALQAAVAAVTTRYGGLPENVEIEFDDTRFETRVRPYADQMSWGKGGYRGNNVRLALLDPVRNWLPMLQVAYSLQASDAIVAFDAAGLVELQRRTSLSTQRHQYQHFLASMMGTAQLHYTKEGLVDLYEQQLRAVGRYHRVVSSELLVGGEPTGEFAVFGTWNGRNFRKIKQVLWTLDPVQGARFTPPDEPIAAPTGDEHLRPLAELLHEKFGGREVGVWKITEHTHLETRFLGGTHVRPALAMLHREGTIEVTGTARPGTFPNDAQVTFRKCECKLSPFSG